ncbi:MAG: hypothetical protein K8I27_11000 [Planctomycetes bacterium]|nr:hypothetical protein [Planctomycetota bacterium]
MSNSRMCLKVAATVICLVAVAMPVVWAGGTLVENNHAGNSGTANGGTGWHATGDNAEYQLITTTGAYTRTETPTQYVLVQEDAWAWDGNSLAADVSGYATGDNWAWSTEFAMEGGASVEVTSYAPQTNPVTKYYGEARSILELTDIGGDFWPEFSKHIDETVSIEQEFTNKVEAPTSVSAGYSILNADSIHVRYETRSYVEAETDRGELKVHPRAWGGVDEGSDWYMKLIRLDDEEVLAEWHLD